MMRLAPAILTLSTAPYHHPTSPNALTKRFDLQDTYDPATQGVAQDLLTLGGRVYMTNVTLASRPYTMVIDTGSSDTWIASSTFKCLSRSRMPLARSKCGLGPLYDPEDSETYRQLQTHDFSVLYADGEFLSGELGSEVFGIGARVDDDVEVDAGWGLKVRQTLGVVRRGWWLGDGRSSGLMGLAYPTLASGGRDLGYGSLMFTIFESPQITIPPIFSLALSRPTPSDPLAGGFLAIGGVPDIKHDGDWISTPIIPRMTSSYAFYSVLVDGFYVTPPGPEPSDLNVDNAVRARETGPFSVGGDRRDGSQPTSWVLRSGNRERPKSRSARESAQTVRGEESALNESRPTNFSLLASSKLDMVIDSGTTLIYLPDAIVDVIASLFSPAADFDPVTGLYTVDCDALSPRFGIIIAGKTFLVHPSDLMGGNGLGKGAIGSCVLAIQRGGMGDAVLGDAFLKNVIVAFDLGNNTIWMAGREVY